MISFVLVPLLLHSSIALPLPEVYLVILTSSSQMSDRILGINIMVFPPHLTYSKDVLVALAFPDHGHDILLRLLLRPLI